MRKSLVMLVLMTLIGSSFVTYLSNASGTDNAVIELSSDSEQVSNADLVEDTAYGEGTGATIVDPIDSYVVPEHVVGSNPIDYYGGLGETTNPYREMDGRGVVNTSTLIYIKKAPKKVHYDESFNVKIQLLEDNDSDGERGGGDYPIMAEWVDVTWNDGSEFAVYFSNMTHPHPYLRDEKLEDGEFNLTLMANESSIAANGDPNGESPGVELVFTYNGVWTTDGQTFYNLSSSIYGLLTSMVIGEDDDNDAPIKQNNNIDDDGDGEPNSPDSFLDSNADTKYQLGEQVDTDRTGGNWIDLDMGLADFLDNDGNGEKYSPDSFYDGSNGYPADSIFQISSYTDHENTGLARYETSFNNPRRMVAPTNGFLVTLGERGPGAEIDYDWSAIEVGATFDFAITDGTNSYATATGSSGTSGTFTVPHYGTQWFLSFTNVGAAHANVTYSVDIDAGWTRLNQAIADGIDNDNDGIVDEFIDEYIDDGRPAIPAVGTEGPEHPNLQRNGIDDDGDGIIDDGYPGIKINENAEGVDEEVFNYADDDGDGLIDEDVRAFVAREPTEKRLYIEIWHKTECSININKRLVEVDEEFVVSGKIWDKSFEDTTMGKKNLILVWDGDPLAQTEAQVSDGYESDYEFVVRVPHRAPAGTHTVSVEFSPGFNKTNNYYFDPCNASANIDVRRPTTVIFDNVDPLTQKTWVYRGSTIYINGSIVDKYLYEEEFLKQGPKLNVNGVDYGNQYRFHVQWGESIQPFAKEWPGNFLISANGSFSIEYELPAGNQPLGPVKVSVRTTWDTSPGRDPLMFYTWSSNTTEFVVRARTELELWIDQNNNGKNDENELNENGQALNTFITRKSFIGANGETFDWNVARVRGILKDQSRSSGSIKVGVPQQRIVFYWNYGLGEPYERKIEEQVDQNGQFDINVPIDPNHKLGPVNIFCVFISEYSTNYYDSSIYSDFDGQPFSVVSFTDMEINASVGVKGKNVQVSGRLTDDTGAGVGNRSVTIYRLERWDGNYNSLNQPGGMGTKLGTATTKSTGKFTFKDYVIEEIINVGTLWLVAWYGGSTEFPYGPGDKRFAPEDAYMSIISEPTKFVITTETVVVLNEVPDILIRNGEARITGNLYEAYKGVKVERGVAGQTVTAYIRQNDELIKLGVGRTKTDPEFNGYFEIKTTNVPDKLDVGKVDIIVDFSPEEGPEGIPLFQESQNVSHAEVWSSTRVKEVYFGPVDANDDKKPDIYEDQVEDWVFTFQILEGNTVETSGEPVPYGVVWFNITMGAYSNTTRLLTDIRGRVNFNFTSTFKDSATGVDFEIPAQEDSSNMTVTVNFVGRQIVSGGGYDHSVRIYHCDYITPEPPPEAVTPWALIFLIIFVLLGMVLIGVFFFYKWIEKRRRLRSLKKIIKKAADQLETGNPYSAVIFKSYQKLGAHLRRYGFMRRDADTFREFEDAVRTALPIDEGSLDSFLDILEEARYSKHVIGEGHRDKAITCLRGVEKSLDNIIFDEEAALRQMELADEEYIETDIVVKGGKGA